MGLRRCHVKCDGVGGVVVTVITSILSIVIITIVMSNINIVIITILMSRMIIIANIMSILIAIAIVRIVKCDLGGPPTL